LGVAPRARVAGPPPAPPEPGFLHRAVPRETRAEEEDMSFLCVPILMDGASAGTLAVEMPCMARQDAERMVKVLRIIASMVSQAVRILRLVEGERQRLVQENSQLREELRERYELSNIVGNSGPMRRVYEQVAQVVGTGATVMILGESGTGKELIAHALHHHSPRAGKPFVRVNCAALPETLVETELFGHERGAFTGAQARRKGKFEHADGGTLFLDEIGELSPSTQAKLLRVLQGREFERLGGNETVRVDVRLLTATNKDLERALAEGTFREDLYYRLNMFTIHVPPLRERRSDVLLLAEHFVEKYTRVHQRTIRRISTPAIDMLMAYHWPGNVRELENTIERAVLVADGDVIHGHHLSPTLQTAEASGTVVSRSLGEAVEVFESNLIQDALKSTRGNRAKAARLLATTERILSYKVRRYGIDPRRFKG
jgi:Nif-specific regulatory protein